MVGSMDDARRPRILLGNLGPIMRMGMRRVLTESGCDVVGQEDRPSAIVGEVHRLRPDIVVLDLDGGSAHQLGHLVAGASPETTVVLWAREEDLMEVIDPVSVDSRRVSAPVLERLRSELNSSNVQRVEE
jgi:AmiR/NasT family two-component response regulator